MNKAALVLATFGAALAAVVVFEARHPRGARDLAREHAITSASGVGSTDSPPMASTMPGPPAALANASSRPVLGATPARDRAAGLREALSWDDEGARIAAVESAVAEGETSVLPVLRAVRLREDPALAPSIIDAVAVLGRRAGGAEAAGAAQTLGTWLREESRREGPDARGNVSVLVDALGDLGGADAVKLLASALDDLRLPLHVETLAVQRLAALGDPSAQPAIERFAARVGALPATDGIDESLRLEALEAILAARGF